MAFLNRNQEEDDELPGSSGLHVDLELRVCPECRREALPWQDACPECGVTPVARDRLPSASSFQVPAHLLEDVDEADPASGVRGSDAADPDDGSGS